MQEFSGPLPPAAVLRGYDELVPGAAARIIEAHLANEKAGADALTRLTRAESTGVTIGSITVPIVAIGGLAGGIWMILAGYPVQALLPIIPGILSSIAVVISAVRGK